MSPSENGNSQNPAEEAPIIYTTDEDGNEHLFQIVEMLEFEGHVYGLLLDLGEEEAKKEDLPKEPSADDEGGYDEEFVLMRIVQDENGDQLFESIEDEEEFHRVVAHIEQMDFDEEGSEGEEGPSPASN